MPDTIHSAASLSRDSHNLRTSCSSCVSNIAGRLHAVTQMWPLAVAEALRIIDHELGFITNFFADELSARQSLHPKSATEVRWYSNKVALDLVNTICVSCDFVCSSTAKSQPLIHRRSKSFFAVRAVRNALSSNRQTHSLPDKLMTVKLETNVAHLKSFRTTFVSFYSFGSRSRLETAKFKPSSVQSTLREFICFGLETNNFKSWTIQ